MSVMDKAELVNSIVTYLTIAAPYLKQLGAIAGVEAAKEVSKQAIKQIGKGSWSAATAIWQKLKGSRPEMETDLDATLTILSENPTDDAGRATMKEQIEKVLEKDSSLFEQLAVILREAKTTGVEGDQNAILDGGASNNVVAIGDGIVIGDNNINLVNKKS
jgi:hypothetical protein